MELCCFVSLSAFGIHTQQVQASFGRLRPLELKLFLIAVFSVNVLLSQCNDPFFFNHRADGDGLPSHTGGLTQRRELWAEPCAHDNPAMRGFYGILSSYRL